jgi:hypothetical protein
MSVRMSSRRAPPNDAPEPNQGENHGVGGSVHVACRRSAIAQGAWDARRCPEAHAGNFVRSVKMVDAAERVRN